MDNACNILIDTLPVTLNVTGRDLPIFADFRTGILFEQLMQDGSIPREEKYAYALELYFAPKELEIVMTSDEAMMEASEQLVWFYACGKTENKEGAAAKDKNAITRRIYDFDIDAQRIYAAFLAQYRIDLQDIEFLHWWKFSALFSCLTEEHEIVKIMGYRSVNVSAIKSKSERQRLAGLQARYALPDERSAEEKQQIAGALFGGMR